MGAGHGIRSASLRYASYWNAFLCINLCYAIIESESGNVFKLLHP